MAIVGGNSANCGGKSEYELTREANIAKNKQLLLQEFGEQLRWGDEGNNENKKKKEKGKKEKKKATQEPTRSSARRRLR